MKYWYICICLLLTGFLHAQNPADIDLLNRQAEAKLNSKPQESLVLAEQAREKATATNYNYGLEKALALTGVAYYKVDQYEQADTLIKQSISLSRDKNDSVNLCYAVYWMGNLNLHKGNYAKALGNFEEVEQLARKINDKQSLARATDGIASLYEALQEYDMADSLYKQSYHIAQQAKFTDWYPNSIFSIANMLYTKGKTSEAIDNYKESIRLSEEVNNLNNKANCLQQLATIYYDQDSLRTAMDDIRQAMDIFEQTGSEISFSYSRLLMSAILIKDRQYKDAIGLAKLSLDKGQAKHEIELQRDAAEMLYYAYIGMRDYPHALDFHVLFHQLSEKNHTEGLSKELARTELQTNFEREREVEHEKQAQKDIESNAKIEREKLSTKTSLIGIVLIAIIAGLAIFAFVQKRRDTRLVAAEKRKSDEILLKILPADMIGELKEMKSDKANTATVLFADIKTMGSAALKPDGEKLQTAIDFYFKGFNDIIAKYEIERIKSEKDTYLCYLRHDPDDRGTANKVIQAALEMRAAAEKIREALSAPGNAMLEISIGAHTGPMVAGIVGLRKAAYDIWGDTVNMAARMEQHSAAGKINISAPTYELVKDRFTCIPHGKVDGALTGPVAMYFVEPALG